MMTNLDKAWACWFAALPFMLLSWFVHPLFILAQIVMYIPATIYLYRHVKGQAA